MSIVRFGVSLEKELLEALDNCASDNHFSNRSQAIRQLINNKIMAVKRKFITLIGLAFKLVAVKGIQHGKLTMSRPN